MTEGNCDYRASQTLRCNQFPSKGKLQILSIAAVSTYMVSEHDHRCDQAEGFMAGYNEMPRRIELEKSKSPMSRIGTK